MLITKLVKKNGKLEYLDSKDKIKYNLLLAKVPDNGIVEVLFTIQHNKASNAQISKLHASIRQIAFELGNSFDDIKSIIKIKTGLIHQDTVGEVIEKSFADCTKEEISLAIETCQTLANEQGIMLG
jgi:hypothetical protein